MKYSPEQNECQQAARCKRLAASRKSRRSGNSKRQSTPITQVSQPVANNAKVAKTPKNAVARPNCLHKVYQALKILIDVMRYTPDSYNSCLQLFQKYLGLSHRLLIRGKFLALTIFFIYSKVYEFRPLPLRCFKEVMAYKVSNDDIIAAEAHVLDVLSYDVHVQYSQSHNNAELEDEIGRLPICQHLVF